MATYRGPGYVVDLPFDQLARVLSTVPGAIREANDRIMTTLGVRACGWAVDDYRNRSAGINAGGTTWATISDAAIRSRLAKRKPWQTLQSEMTALHAEAEPLLEILRKLLPKNATLTKSGKVLDPSIRKKQRGKIARDYLETEKRLEQIKARRAAVRAKKQSLFDTEKAAAQIGVDTGRLIASLVFGRPELADIKVAAPKGGNPPAAMFDVSPLRVRIGSNLSYAKYFDARRPIISSGFITSERKAALEAVGRDEIQRILDDVVGLK